MRAPVVEYAAVFTPVAVAAGGVCGLVSAGDVYCKQFWRNDGPFRHTLVGTPPIVAISAALLGGHSH